VNTSKSCAEPMRHSSPVGFGRTGCPRSDPTGGPSEVIPADAPRSAAQLQTSAKPLISPVSPAP
jgi:hypothetical protein